MHAPPSFQPPPFAEDETGAVRTVGVEIEFGGLTERAAAETIRGLYGGRIEEVDPHLLTVRGTALGDFTVELDLWLVHGRSGSEKPGLLAEWHDALKAALGEVARTVVPCEIAAPPLPWTALARLEPLVGALRAAGAEGTREHLAYGFGFQLNLRAATLSPEYLLSVLRAFLLLDDGLRAEIGIDPTRRLLPFIDRFPDTYLALVLDPEYRPSRTALIDDYLEHNATRNRDLDLLPLFAHLDAARVRAAVPDEGVKARPTFHYRLPNSALDDPDWTIAVEWNRWIAVERLAADVPRLTRVVEDWLGHLADDTLSRWPEASGRWLASLRR
jgi:hypothetical protein